jgi:hypothetical protein
MTGESHCPRPFLFIGLSVTALFLGLSGYCPPASARDFTFQGVAGLCLFNPTGVTRDTKGGIDFEYGYEFYYRIETDHPLINGWETLISNTRLNPGGQAFYFGTATLEPDIAPGSTLAGKFFFPADANPIKGNYFGTGDLARVVVQYELFPDELIPRDYSYLCDGKPPLFGYWMYGSVRNYKDR